MKSAHKKSIKHKKVFLYISLFILLIISVISFIFFFTSNIPQPPPLNVTLGDRGFSPEAIVIKQDTKVTWIIDGNNYHWPASNFHPTHTQYPGGGGCIGSKLDACREMKKGEKFSFIFDQVGNWGMHDHLYPGYTMNVKVVENHTSFSLQNFFLKIRSFFQPTNLNNKHATIKAPEPAEKVAQEAKKNCENNIYNINGKGGCYAKEMENISFKYGYEYAYNVLHALEKIDDAAFKQCHIISHGIGWGAYKTDPKNWRSFIDKLSSECAYGSIHGLLEQYVNTLSGGKLTKKDLLTICEGKVNVGCNHALGHLLLVTTGGDMNKTLDLCDSLDRQWALNSCYSGAFMEHHIAQTLSQHILVDVRRRNNWPSLLYEDEKFCNGYSGLRQTMCWTRLSASAEQYFKHDPKQIFTFCNRAPTIDAARGCKLGSFTQLFYAMNFDLPKLQYQCTKQREIDSDFEGLCYNELVNISFAVFKPDKVDNVITFCLSLNNTYKNKCLKRVGLNFKLYGKNYKFISDRCGRIKNQQLHASCIGEHVNFL